MDNAFIIENLLRQNESDVLEFKVSISPDNIAKVITAMLNNRGGDILVGVEDNKQVVGINKKIDTNGLLNKLMSEITPTAPIDIRCIDYQGKNVLLIRVWEGSQKPYSYKGSIYQKIGYRGKSISRILADRKEADLSWERTHAQGAEISDLDMVEVRKTMDMYQKTGANVGSDEEEFLINNGLMINGNITYACVLLYAKNPLKFLPQAGIRLSVFSSESFADLIDSINYTDNIFKNVESIIQYLDSRYAKRIRVDDIQRTETWNYPRIAVREGIMNAIIHRDYSTHQGFLYINLYPNHLDILNYGAMEPIISYVNKGVLEYSKPRNPDIAFQCYYRNLIEMRGTGILRMNNECKNNNFATPIYSISGDVVKVSFPNLQLQVSHDNESIIESLLNQATITLTQTVKQKLYSVINVIINNPGIKAKAISESMGIPKKSIDRYLTELKQMKIICYKGSKKSGGFYVMQ